FFSRFPFAFPRPVGENTPVPRYFSQEFAMKKTSRRGFLKASAAASGALAVSNLTANAFPGGNDLIRVGLVGCGGRGSGAVEQNLRADSNCKLFAVGDAFRDRAEG